MKESGRIIKREQASRNGSTREREGERGRRERDREGGKKTKRE